VNDILEKMT